MESNSTDGFFRGRRILVTGGTGFIGMPLVKALEEASAASITVVSWGIPLPEKQFVEHVLLDLSDAASVASFLANRDFDSVYHLAGVIDQSARPGIYQEQIRWHVNATLNLVEALAGHVGRFVHVGSNAEYGGAPCPQVPDGPAWPNSAYGLSKHAASQLVLAKQRSEGFPGVVARPFMVYGPGQGKKSFLSLALAAALQNKDFPTTLGQQTRDFTPLESVVTGLLDLAQTTGIEGCAFNLCTGVEIQIREPLDMLRELCPGFNPQFGAVAYRPTELMRSVGVPFRAIDQETARLNLRDFLQSVLAKPGLLEFCH